MSSRKVINNGNRLSPPGPSSNYHSTKPSHPHPTPLPLKTKGATYNKRFVGGAGGSSVILPSPDVSSTRAVRDGPPTPLTPLETPDSLGLLGEGPSSLGVKRKMEEQRSLLSRYFFDKIESVKAKKAKGATLESDAASLSKESSVGSCVSNYSELGGGGASHKRALTKESEDPMATSCHGVECSCAPCRGKRSHHQLINTKYRQQLQAECLEEQEQALDDKARWKMYQRRASDSSSSQSASTLSSSSSYDGDNKVNKA